MALYSPNFSIIFKNHTHESYSTIYLHLPAVLPKQCAMRLTCHLFFLFDDSAMQLFTFFEIALLARLAWEDSFSCVPRKGFEGF